MNEIEFNVQMVKNSETQSRLAADMGMAASALNARIKGHVDFRQKEISFLRKRWGLTPEQVLLIFFDDNVSNLDICGEGA